MGPRKSVQIFHFISFHKPNQSIRFQQLLAVLKLTDLLYMLITGIGVLFVLGSSGDQNDRRKRAIQGTSYSF